MKWFHRALKPEVPAVVAKVKVDREAAEAAVVHAVTAHECAQRQAEAARAAAAGLARVRIRNGFAPAIEESIIRRYLGGTAQ